MMTVRRASISTTAAIFAVLTAAAAAFAAAPGTQPAAGSEGEPVLARYALTDIVNASRASEKPNPNARVLRPQDPFGDAPPFKGTVVQDVGLLLIQHVDPNSWTEAGGGPGEVKIDNIALVIRQSPRNHKRVQRMLDLLRKPQPWNRLAVDKPRADKRKPAAGAAGAAGDAGAPPEDESVQDEQPVILRVYDIRSLPVLAAGVNGPVTREQALDDLVNRITETVAKGTWRHRGGTIGAANEWSGRLIVTQTPENHEKLLQALKDWSRK